MLHVAAAWLTGTPATSGSGTAIGRIIAACARAARGAAAPLLALPTHAGGWIAPGVLVERVRAVGETADEVELAQALLRLAPEGRDPESAHDLPGRPGRDRALRARRARGARRRRRRPRRARRSRAAVDPVDVEVDDVELTRTPPGPLEGPLGEYLVTVTGEQERHGRFATEPLAWPLRRDIQCAGVFWHVALRPRARAPPYAAAGPFLELLTREGEPLAPLSLRLALQALCSSAERDHLTAVDLLIAAIEDGRVDAPALVPALREELPRVLTNRLGPRLMTVAGAGPLQRAVVRDLLDATVSALAGLETRTYGALLVPFDELCAQTGRACTIAGVPGDAHRLEQGRQGREGRCWPATAIRRARSTRSRSRRGCGARSGGP